MTRSRLTVATFLLLAAGLAHAAGVDSFLATTLDTPDGKTVSLDSFRGKPLLVNFISRACETCPADVAELSKLRQAPGNKQLSVITIVIEESPEDQASFIKTLGATHPVLISGNRKAVWLMQNLGNPRGRPPFTVAIDKAGKLVATRNTALTAAETASLAGVALQ